MSFHKKLSEKLLTKDKLQDLLKEWNSQNKQIVFLEIYKTIFM